MSRILITLSGVTIEIFSQDIIVTEEEEPKEKPPVVDGKSKCLICGADVKPQRKYCSNKCRMAGMRNAKHAKNKVANSQYLQILAKSKDKSPFLKRRFDEQLNNAAIEREEME